MQSIESNARYLASAITMRLFETEVFEDDFLFEMPREYISKITGKRYKKPRANCPKKHLSVMKSVLTGVKGDDSFKQTLEHNINVLTHTLSLPDICKPVLKICVVTTLNNGLYQLFDEQIRHFVTDIDLMISETLGLSIEELSQAVVILSNTSLFKQSSPCFLGLLLMPLQIARNLMATKVVTYHELLSGLYSQIEPSELTLKDYPHIELRFISEFLKLAVKQKSKGCNVLIYGPAGSGKSNLSRVLSKFAKCNLVAIKARGESLFSADDEITSEHNTAHLRLQHYRLMQNLFKPNKFSCLLLDEAEDIFIEYLNGVKISKERLHTLLETNELPCFWITNHVELLPDSVIRRFSYVLQVPIPSKKIRTSMISSQLKGLRLSQAYKNSLADIPDLAPAHVANAANVAKTLHLTAKAAEKVIDHHIHQCLSACGLQTSVTSYQPEMVFDPRFINLSGSHKNINEIIKTITHFNFGRYLLLGPPGTGKSAFANYIAEELDQQLITIRPSDVLSKYHGEDQQNIANLFKQANESNAIIFLDEVDSVLTSREAASELHQRQLINQILIELDQTQQVVLAATNSSINRLDAALARRIDFKLNFEYLTTQQVLTLYKENFGDFSTTIRKQLKTLHCLAMGDFAVLSRINRMNKKIPSDDKNLEILTEENNRKVPRNAIGFI